MSYLNKIHIIGNITQSPQFNTTQNGNSVVNLNVATNENWTNKHGEKQQETEYHLVTAWGKTAEFVRDYCDKGHMIYVEGRKQTKPYPSTTPGGEQIERHRCEIIASKLIKLSKDDNYGRSND